MTGSGCWLGERKVSWISDSLVFFLSHTIVQAINSIIVTRDSVKDELRPITHVLRLVILT